MQNYELLLIVPAEVSDKEIPQISEKVAGIITQEGGKINLEDNLGRKKLTYPIKKNEVGTYLLFQFVGDPSTIKKMNMVLGQTPEIIRYLITANPPTEKELERKPISMGSRIIKEKAKEQKTEKREKTKISLEDLEEKLDNILEDDILK